jgi:DNA-directed RNA polymerase specialized sigma24 family protein
MSAESVGSISLAFAKLRGGDPDAVRQLWERFFPRLMALAHSTLAGRPQRMADADDAVQSAFLSFWQKAAQGDFGPSLDRNDLWNVLGIITVRKARKQTRREIAQKRGGGQVLGEADLYGPQGETLALEELAATVPAQEFDLHCEELLRSLDEELRTFALLRLFGYLNREIANLLRCTERKVERKLQVIRMQWERLEG